MKIAYIGLGTNLGDRKTNLDTALQKMEECGIKVVRNSSIYETEPQDVKNQPLFLNMASAVHSQLLPRQLLKQLLKIERVMGRRRLIPKGPRPIDLDILLYGSAVIRTAELEVPHPGIAHRRFVLEPLAEIAPDLRHPVIGKTIKEMRDAVLNQYIRKYISCDT